MRPKRRLRRTAALALLLPFAYAVLPAATPSIAAPAGSARVRVNQVGYPTAVSKRAYLLSTDDQTGATFTVRTGASRAFTGTVGADLGRWSKTYTHVYPIDFDALSTAGTFTIQVAVRSRRRRRPSGSEREPNCMRGA